MTPSARLAAAIALLEAVEAAPRRPADATASEFFRARRWLTGVDRRAVADQVWAILRIRRRLGWWLARVDSAPTPRMLLAAALLFDGWTERRLAQSYSGGMHAPAVLDEEERAELARLAGHTLDHPDMPEAVRLEIPDFLLPRLRARFGDALEAELAAMAVPPSTHLRVNLLKSTRAEAQALLAAEGFVTTPTELSPWGLRLNGRRTLTSGKAFQSGLVEIQDEGSQLVALLVGAAPEMRVADYCAGAAGKTLALAMTMGNRGHVVACDTSEPRLEGAVRRLRRAGVHNVERHLLAPGDKWAKRRAGSFDRVLVDAPCTGTGTWRRNPDARLSLEETDLAELSAKQAAILDSAQRLVKPGGRLIYATCSLLPEENEAQIDAFLHRHGDFALLPIAKAWHGAPPCEGPFLVLTPRIHGTDGFFAAVLRRSGEPDARLQKV